MQQKTILCRRLGVPDADMAPFYLAGRYFVLILQERKDAAPAAIGQPFGSTRRAPAPTTVIAAG
jgi:hypothetical protein